MTAKKDPTDRVLQEIIAGRHDGRMQDILEALGQRVTSGAVGTVWRFKLGDVNMTDDDLTVGEVEDIELAFQQPWAKCPAPESSALAARRIGSVVLRHRAGFTEEEADQRLRRLSFRELVEEVFTREQVNPGPLDSPPPPAT